MYTRKLGLPVAVPASVAAIIITSRSKSLCDSETHASTDNSFSVTDNVRLSKEAVSAVKKIKKVHSNVVC